MAKTILGSLLILVLVMNYGNAIWIEAKAGLAQVLIANAWANTLHTGNIQKPWRWADTWPVARVRHPATNTDLYILEGSTGNALAFGPGHNPNSDLPGEGPSIIGGHRDTHFEFLKDAQLKDELLIQGMDGIWLTYQITDMEVRDSEKQLLMVDQDSDKLYLITCYPFDALLPGGPLRYLVIASPTRQRSQASGQESSRSKSANILNQALSAKASS